MTKINEEKLKREVEAYITDINPDVTFDEVFNFAKFQITENPFYSTPCEDCDNVFCINMQQEKPDWKLFYCIDNR